MVLSMELFQSLFRRTTHSLEIMSTGDFLVHWLASANTPKRIFKLGRRFCMDAGRQCLFLFLLLSSWSIVLITIQLPVYFYCSLTFRHKNKTILEPWPHWGAQQQWNITRRHLIVLDEQLKQIRERLLLQIWVIVVWWGCWIEGVWWNNVCVSIQKTFLQEWL